MTRMGSTEIDSISRRFFNQLVVESCDFPPSATPCVLILDNGYCLLTDVAIILSAVSVLCTDSEAWLNR